MCIIIENRTGKAMDSETAENCVSLNPDGFGIVYLDSGETFKTLDMDFAKRLLVTENRPYVAHCRYATVGSVCSEGIHPFPLGGGRTLFMNGTVETRKGLPSSHSDTLVLSKALRGLKTSKIVTLLTAMSPTRFLVADGKKGRTQRVGRWHKSKGIHYSKDNVLKQRLKFGSYDDWAEYAYGPIVNSSGNPATVNEPSESHLVAVYGTLKYARSNHRVMDAAKGEFRGYAETRDKHRMIIEGLPYVVNNSDGNTDGWHIEVEIYEVDDAGLSVLDELEGHPDFYQRIKTEVIMDRVTGLDNISGTSETAWLYTVGTEYLGDPLADGYKQPTFVRTY